MAKKAQVQTEQAAPRGFHMGDVKRVLAAEEAGVAVHLHGIDGKPYFFQNGAGPKPVEWGVAGRYSDRYRRAEEDVSRERASKEGQDADPFDPKNYLEDRIKLHSRVVLWVGEGSYDEDGNPLPCEPQVIERVLLNCPWVLPQIAKGTGDHAGFQKTALGG